MNASVDLLDVGRTADAVRSFLERSGVSRWDRASVRMALAHVTTLDSGADPSELVGRVLAHLQGLGVLDRLFGDAAVSDVLINGPGPVWVERNGELVLTDAVVSSDELNVLVERLVAASGTRVDPAHPIADARLTDGTRVCVVGPPLAANGPVVAMRRFAASAVSIEEFVEPSAVALIDDILDRQLNVLVFGGTGAGKTTVLNALGARFGSHERVVTIEDTAELRLSGQGVVSLETRQANNEGAGEVTMAALVRAALRLRPDRLVIGEVRGREAAEMVTALSTGHRGGLSTCHAGSPEEALDRVEEMALMNEGAGAYQPVVRRRVRRAIDVLIGVARGEGPSRHVAGIWETVGDGDPHVRLLWQRGDSRWQPPKRTRTAAVARPC